jgi:coproporphyrinogen dehydrogenase HemZ
LNAEGIPLNTNSNLTVRRAMTFETTFKNYENDLSELVREFLPLTADNFSLYLTGGWNGKNELWAELISDKFQNFKKYYSFYVSDEERAYEGKALGGTPEIILKRLEKRYLKIALYRTLQFLTGVSLPYGALTGIRPTKLYYDLSGTGRAFEIFTENFSVSRDKALLIKSIVEEQEKIKSKSEKEVDVFVNIPFCPTRCAYCSFVSVPINKHEKYLKSYKNCLIQELSIIKNIISENNFEVRSLYFGGGTPTSLPTVLLNEILSAADFRASEFTVEAGRPDTLDKRTLNLLKSAGATRISINPQTFNDATLLRIGRNHTAADILKAYKLAKGMFDINMDLIAALPGETLGDFKASVDKAVELAPENITVHTLSLKRGSELKQSGAALSAEQTAEMIDYSYRALTSAGYRPYYMYRQKYMSGNLENVGYAKEGKACKYNVDIMEETTSIIAAGAGAIGKRIFPAEYRIERQPNFKGVLDYINRFDEIAQKKAEFWRQYRNQ